MRAAAINCDTAKREKYRYTRARAIFLLIVGRKNV